MGNATAFGTRFRDVDLTTFDTTVALEHASNQAKQRHYEDFLIVDVDSHHYETESFKEIAEFIEDPVLRHEAKYQGFSGGGINIGKGSYQEMGGRIVRYRARKKEIVPPHPHRDITLMRRWMDAMGTDIACMFPTPMLNLATVEPSELRTWRVPVLAVGAKDILGLFVDPVSPDALESDDFAAWRLAARWALDILAGGRYVPTAHYSGPDPVAVWRPWLNNPTDQERLARLAAALPPSARAATAVSATKGASTKVTATSRARKTGAAAPTPLDPGPELLLTDFVDAVVDATLRKRLSGMRFFKSATRRATLGSRWLRSLGAAHPELRCSATDVYSLRDWAVPRRVDQSGAHLSLRLDLPEATDDWTLRYLLQSREDASLSWPASVVWDARAARRQRLPEDAQETLLAGLGLASRLFAPIYAQASRLAAREGILGDHP